MTIDEVRKLEGDLLLGPQDQRPRMSKRTVLRLCQEIRQSRAREKALLEALDESADFMTSLGYKFSVEEML